MLQNRIISYQDAHRYRLGVNYNQIPVNQAKHATVHTYHRDGLMRVDGNNDGQVNYEPNSFGGPEEASQYREPPLKIDAQADRYNSYPCDDADYYEQPGLFYRQALNDTGRQHLVENLVSSLQDAPRAIQLRQLYHFYKADTELGESVAHGLDLEVKEAMANQETPTAV
jgi:catalase